MVEWLNKMMKRKRRFTPADNLHYFVESGVVTYTDAILKEYGRNQPSAEGIVYWAGTKREDRFYITSAIAPKAVTSRHGILVSHESNAQFVDYLCDNQLIYLAQVHSHPSTWVDHSGIDDAQTAFRHEGLVSIVVPDYSMAGLLPFNKCGVHRFQSNKFIRLSNQYVSKHFHILSNEGSIKNIDLRNAK